LCDLLFGLSFTDSGSSFTGNDDFGRGGGGHLAFRAVVAAFVRTASESRLVWLAVLSSADCSFFCEIDAVDRYR